MFATITKNISVKPLGATKQCAHCQQPTYDHSKFCCHGCATAYELIHSMGLSQFYQIEPNEGRHSPEIDTSSKDFSFLDSSVYCNASCDSTDFSLTLRVENIHCYACCWLIKHSIQKRFANVTADVNLATHTLRLSWRDVEFRPSMVGTMLYELGYPVHIEATNNGSASNRSDLMRIGIAWFCAANIMTFAIADYLSDDLLPTDPIKRSFHWIQAILGIVVVTYCAWPLIRNSINFATRRRITIDQPIVVALAATTIVSLHALLTSSGNLYFDSLSAVIALLMTGRYLQIKFLAKSELQLSTIQLNHDKLNVSRKGQRQLVSSQDIKKRDILDLHAGDIIPCRIRVLSQIAHVSMSAMTGEPGERMVGFGETLPSGAILGNFPIQGEALEDANTSSLNIIRRLTDALAVQKGQISVLSDKIAAAFLFAIPMLAIATAAFWWRITGVKAMEPALAVLLVACPCAFGFAVPLIFARASAFAFRSGFIFRSQRALETAARCKNIFFDKTGTLTVSTSQVAELALIDTTISGLGLSNKQVLATLHALCACSRHHVARAIMQSTKSTSEEISIREVKETFGFGISGKWGHHHLSLHKCVDTTVGVATEFTINGYVVARIKLTESVAAGVPAAIRRLQSSGFNIAILSGDQARQTSLVSQQLGISESRGDLSPTNKALLIKQKPDASAMVGNGFNDLPGFSTSALSIAVQNSPDAVRSRADVFVFSQGLTSLESVFAIARAAKRTMYVALTVATFYNLVGIAFAMSGHLTPLIAALLMPASSASVIAISTSWHPTLIKQSGRKGK